MGQVELALLSLGFWDASPPTPAPAPITLQPPPPPLQVLQTLSVLLERPAHCQAHCSQLNKGARNKCTQTIATVKTQVKYDLQELTLLSKHTEQLFPGILFSEGSVFDVIFWFCNVQVLNGLSFYLTMPISIPLTGKITR